MEGYHKVAEYMSDHNEIAIFRRFKTINFLTLLHLQSDITRLEAELFRVAGRCTNLRTAKDWYELCGSEDSNDQTQLGLTIELQKRIEVYNRVLLQQADLLKLTKPHTYNLQFLQAWLKDDTKGNWPLTGRDSDTWHDHEADLIALRTEPSRNKLSNALTYKVIPFLYGHCGSDSSGDREISDTLLATTIEVLGSLIASLMPLAAILALYFIKNELARLFAIVGFTAGFCLAIMFMTEGTRQVEVFAATSAYAAVLVVYISQGH